MQDGPLVAEGIGPHKRSMGASHPGMYAVFSQKVKGPGCSRRRTFVLQNRGEGRKRGRDVNLLYISSLIVLFSRKECFQEVVGFSPRSH